MIEIQDYSKAQKWSSRMKNLNQIRNDPKNSTTNHDHSQHEYQAPYKKSEQLEFICQGKCINQTGHPKVWIKLSHLT